MSCSLAAGEDFTRAALGAFLGVRDDEVDKEDAEDMDVDAEPIALAIDEVPTERAPPNGIKGVRAGGWLSADGIGS